VTPEALLPVVMGTLQFMVFARALGAFKDAEVAQACYTLFTLLTGGPPSEPALMTRSVRAGG